MTLSWALIAYVACGIAASGILIMQGTCALQGRARGAQVPADIVAIVLALAAGVAGVMRFGRPEVAFHALARLSSGISQGYVAIILLLVAGVIALVALVRSEQAGRLPAWASIVVLVVGIAGTYGIAANLTATALSIPKTLLVAAYLLCAAACCGALMFGALDALRPAAGAADQDSSDASSAASASAASKEFGTVGVIGAVAAGVLAIVVAAVAPRLGGHSSSVVTSPYGMVGAHATDSITAVASGTVLASDKAPLFWCVAIVVGAVIPLICALVVRKGKRAPSAVCGIVGALCALAGVCTTVALVLFASSVTSLLN